MGTGAPEEGRRERKKEGSLALGVTIVPRM